MHEGVCNHLTVKAPSLKVGGLPIMLTAPYGVYWTEITPQDLVGKSISSNEYFHKFKDIQNAQNTI